MYKIIRKQNASVRKIADSYSALNYVNKDISPNMSLAVTDAQKHQETETTLYDRIYYLLEGKAIFIFDDKKVILEKGDSCFISKNTTYEISGTFKSVIVNQPAFGT